MRKVLCRLSLRESSEEFALLSRSERRQSSRHCFPQQKRISPRPGDAIVPHFRFSLLRVFAINFCGLTRWDPITMLKSGVGDYSSRLRMVRFRDVLTLARSERGAMLRVPCSLWASVQSGRVQCRFYRRAGRVARPERAWSPVGAASQAHHALSGRATPSRPCPFRASHSERATPLKSAIAYPQIPPGAALDIDYNGAYNSLNFASLPHLTPTTSQRLTTNH